MASANLSRVSKKLLELLVEREMDVFDGVWKKYGDARSQCQTTRTMFLEHFKKHFEPEPTR